jgi:hypothetical protein
LDLKVCLPAHDLGRIDRFHLVHPTCSWYDLAHSTHFVRGIAWDADVVVALEDELKVTNVELGRFAQLAKFAGAADDVVDEVVGELEDGLGWGLAFGLHDSLKGLSYLFDLRGQRLL